MAKMTPEQEAAYALGFGVSRKGLSLAAQEVYDRLLEQRRRGEPDAPLSLADADRCRHRGSTGPSSVIESLENLGWRLDQMSWVPRAGHRAEGYFLFRRYRGPSGS
ncbi:MAG TPA: hypothetical protein VMC83_32975 [Streptosporangiaceae bacterium]|jgi:hypothetical protein|nr:hypothetical protein [Streptosporangiaceae bacterium]